MRYEDIKVGHHYFVRRPNSPDPTVTYSTTVITKINESEIVCQEFPHMPFNNTYVTHILSDFVSENTNKRWYQIWK